MKPLLLCGCAIAMLAEAAQSENSVLPYDRQCTERERVFEFTRKPSVRLAGPDRYEIQFSVKGYCDVTVGIVDEAGTVVRHLGSGVLGKNAPAPFQKDALVQTIYWNGKDDLAAYVKDPGKMRARVRLGLRPEFDKLLGGANPKNIPAHAWGISADENGVYLFTHAPLGHFYLRRFDHDGNYVRSLLPPPADLPPEKLEGMGFVEYEPGRKALHTFDVATSVSGDANYLSRGIPRMPLSCQPAVVNGRIYYCTAPGRLGAPSLLHYIGADGSCETKGTTGRSLLTVPMSRANFAASPDGRWLYMAGDDESNAFFGSLACAVFRCSVAGDEPAEVFGGVVNKPGSDNSHFNRAQGLDCDGQGRIYVCDNANNRLQVLLPDGKFAKSIRIDRPVQVKVHRRTGAVYVLHTARAQGASVTRISKLASLDNPGVELSFEPAAGLMALDSWTPKPRIWLAGAARVMSGRFSMENALVTIWEEDGKTFRKIADFEEEARNEAGANYMGPWSGLSVGGSGGRGKISCDPVREEVYYENSWVFDLKSGRLLGCCQLPGDDIAFDKKGYVHVHFNPGGDNPGVGRMDPGQRRKSERSRPASLPGIAEVLTYPEVPYDYGLEPRDPQSAWKGVLPVRDQPGAKHFQDGIGVTMMGDVAEVCNIYYAPKRDDESESFTREGDQELRARGVNLGDADQNNYERFVASIEQKQKRGEEVYWIRPKPGEPLLGATIWTWNSSGELRDECAITAGKLINGVMMDEDGGLYFVVNRARQIGGKAFLAGRGGVFGAGKNSGEKFPFTGTLIKTGGKRASFLLKNAPLPADSLPNRAVDLTAYHDDAWVEGAEWLYAGASPIVPGGCSCPTQRLHLDWHKRVYVPEAYRHSIGVLDSNGNLLLHLGQYGNLDSGNGPASRIPVGGDGIAFCDARMISGTDNYLCFVDHGERIVVLKLKYQAEETVGIH